MDDPINQKDLETSRNATESDVRSVPQSLRKSASSKESEHNPQFEVAKSLEKIELDIRKEACEQIEGKVGSNLKKISGREVDMSSSELLASLNNKKLIVENCDNSSSEDEEYVYIPARKPSPQKKSPKFRN